MLLRGQVPFPAYFAKAGATRMEPDDFVMQFRMLASLAGPQGTLEFMRMMGCNARDPSEVLSVVQKDDASRAMFQAVFMPVLVRSIQLH
jgi:hypothetical protein